MELVRTPCAAIALAALLLAPAAARAASEVESAALIGNVRLAGERVVYDGSDRRGRDFVRVAGGSEPAYTAFREPRRTRVVITGIEASPSHFAFAVLSEVDAGRVQTSLYAAPVGGQPSAALVTCRAADVAFGVSGDKVAYACRDESREVRVRSLATGAEQTIAVGAPVREVEIAGEFVGVQRPTSDSTGRGVPQEAVVHDASGAVLYRASGPPIDESPFFFGLQEDGKLAAAAPGPGGFTGGIACFSDLAWYSPAEPQAHTATREVCASQVEFSDATGDRLGFRRNRGRELAVSDLAGNVRAVARFPVVQGLTSLTGWDFDGARFAWGDRLCSESAVYVEDAGATAGPARSRRCPATLRTRRATLSRGGVLPLRVACPRGCRAEFDVLLIGRDESALHSGRFDLGPGSHTVRTRIPRALRRVVGGMSRAGAVIRLRVEDRVGDLDRELERRITVRVR